MSDRRRRKKGAGATATSVAASAAATAADAVKIAISEVSRRISGGLSGLQSHVERDPSSSPDFADSPGEQHPFHSPLDRRTPGLPTVPESQPIGLHRGETGGIALEPHHPPHTAVQQSAAAEDAQACLPQGQSAGNGRPHALDGTGPSAFSTLDSCLTWLSAQAHQLTYQLLGSFPPPPDAQADNLRPPPSLLSPTPLPRWLPLCLLLGLLASFCLAYSWSASSQRHLTVHLVSQLEAQAEEMAALQAWAQDLNTSWHAQLDEHLGISSTQLEAEWKQQAAQALASQQQLAGELAAAKEQVQGLQGQVEELRGQVGAHAAGFGALGPRAPHPTPHLTGWKSGKELGGELQQGEGEAESGWAPSQSPLTCGAHDVTLSGWDKSERIGPGPGGWAAAWPGSGERRGGASCSTASSPEPHLGDHSAHRQLVAPGSGGSALTPLSALTALAGPLLPLTLHSHGASPADSNWQVKAYRALHCVFQPSPTATTASSTSSPTTALPTTLVSAGRCLVGWVRGQPLAPLPWASAVLQPPGLVPLPQLPSRSDSSEQEQRLDGSGSSSSRVVAGSATPAQAAWLHSKPSTGCLLPLLGPGPKVLTGAGAGAGAGTGAGAGAGAGELLPYVSVRFAQPLPLKGLAALTLAWPGPGATLQQVPVPVAVRVWLLLTAENGQVQVQVKGHTTDRSNSSLSNNRANSSRVGSNVTSSSNMSSYSNSSNSNSSSSRGPTRDGGSAAASRGALQSRQSLEQVWLGRWLLQPCGHTTAGAAGAEAGGAGATGAAGAAGAGAVGASTSGSGVGDPGATAGEGWSHAGQSGSSLDCDPASQPPAAAWLAARGWATQVIRLQPASQQPVQGQDPAGVAAGGKAEASRSSNNVASNRLSRLSGWDSSGSSKWTGSNGSSSSSSSSSGGPESEPPLASSACSCRPSPAALLDLTPGQLVVGLAVQAEGVRGLLCMPSLFAHKAG